MSSWDQLSNTPNVRCCSQSDLVKIALAQTSVSAVPDENLAGAEQYAADASQRGAKLLILPEMFMALPRKDSPLSVVAEPLDGHFFSSLAHIAHKYELHLTAGVWEKIAGEERVHNTAIIISAKGKLLAAYRKLHLFDALHIQESRTMLAGGAFPPVVSLDGLACGVAICYDLRFPEVFRSLALRGADVILVPSAWYAGLLKEEHWLTLLRARAIENTCYLVGVNQIGSAFCGRSAVFDPFGVQVADAGDEEQLLFAELHAARLTQVREKLPTLQHVRTDILGAEFASVSSIEGSLLPGKG